jgi:tripartite-type tricarboxylate transporter receptor subunit TctC
MKKILSLLIMIVASAWAQAQIIVPVVWVFSPTSTQGLMIREIVNEANLIQKKYQFVLETRGGAGGAVGTNYVLSLRQPAVLAHTSSFFIRPYMDKEGAYDPEQFQMLNAYCQDQPLALISRNYKTLSDLQKQTKLSAGILPGSITQLVTTEFKIQNANINLVEAGFKGTPEITTAVLGGHLDFGIDFLAGVNNNDLNVLGITGTQNYGRARTFRSQGLSGYENITSSYYLFVAKNTDTAIVRDLNEIMIKAVTNKNAIDYCKKDFGQPSNVTGDSARDLMRQKHQYWRLSVEKIIK